MDVKDAKKQPFRKMLSGGAVFSGAPGGARFSLI